MNPYDPRDDDTADLPRVPGPGRPAGSGPRHHAPDTHGDDAYGNGAYGNGAYGNGAYGDGRYGNSYGDDPYGDAPRRRGRAVFAVVVAVLIVVGVGAAGWALLRPSSGTGPDLGVGGATTTGATPTGVATTPPVPSSAPNSRAATATPTRTKAKPRPTPTKKPPKSQLPPPPPKPKPGCTPKDPGPDAPHDQVAAALAAAGARHYWDGVVPPDGVHPNALVVPADLMDAIAWTESSWRSTVVACDGGVGLMQIMPGTLADMNRRFETSYNSAVMTDNVAAGAQYLQWLTVYFGHYYFGVTDFGADDLMSVSGPVGTGGRTLTLLDVVLSAYNVGPGAVEDDHGTPDDGSDDTLSIPNPSYVSSVHANLANCPCR